MDMLPSDFRVVDGAYEIKKKVWVNCTNFTMTLTGEVKHPQDTMYTAMITRDDGVKSSQQLFRLHGMQMDWFYTGDKALMDSVPALLGHNSVASDLQGLFNRNVRNGNIPPSSSSTNCDEEFIPQQSTSRQKLFSPPSVILQIPFTGRSHSRCFVCKRPGPKLVNLSSEGRFNSFVQHNLMITDARCCPRHLNDCGYLRPECVGHVQTLADTSFLSRSAINDLLQKLRIECLNQKNSPNFDAMNDSTYQSMTGLTRAQFLDVCSHLVDKVKNTPNRSPRTSVGLFLVKLFSGMSNDVLSTIFGVSKSSVRRAIHTVRQAFMRSFVPLYLGLECVTRENIINEHTRPLAKELFATSDENIILVLDGTYIYIDKSNNFQFQRRSYSMHKGRPLVKPMVVVTTTGHVVTIVGPYLADGKNNDAAILNHMLRQNIEDIRAFLQEGDVLIVDRGFRDSLSLLSDLGIQAEMPALLSKGQKQMTTEEANSSRLVTKIRWVVESANARIKRYKYLQHTMKNSQIPYIGDYIRIVCALSNKYSPPLCSPGQREKDEQMAKRMLEQSAKSNILKDMVEEKGLNRKLKVWKAVDEFELDTFPRLTDNDLSQLTLGVYQLRLSSSYIQEHLDGNCDIKLHIDEPNLLAVKMQSRHTSSRMYMLWIRFSDTAILEWFCQCRAGARVVGMCSHVAAMVWYLSYARFQERESYGVRDWGKHLSDAANFEIQENPSSCSSESDSD